MRYFFEISYNGARYAGWQSQANALGIQTVLEECLSTLLRTPVKIVGSGRTDTGVHCAQQFFHADMDTPLDNERFRAQMNSFLPPDLAILSIREVKSDAHARFSATERTYRYQITRNKNPFMQGYALHYFKPLDVQTMNRAAALLTGEHDFASFSKVKTDVNHFLCRIKRAEWKEQGDLLVFHITANRFLRGMVRALVGTLLDVGSGKITVADFRKILAAKDRRMAGANAAPHGLYLVRVKYRKSIFLR